MDKLQKYLLDNREELDADLPGDAVWQRIQQTTTPAAPPARVVSIKILRYAAAACIAGLVATAAYWFIHPSNTTTLPSPAFAHTNDTNHATETIEPTVPVVADLPASETITPTLTQQKEQHTARQNSVPKKKKYTPLHHQQDDEATQITNELSNGYAQLVSMQLTRLRTTPVYAEDANYFSDFKAQLKQMDRDEAAIRKDIKSNGLNDVLLQQLINVYQQKLSVLKNLQTEIIKMNNQVKQKQLPTDSVKSHFINI